MSVVGASDQTLALVVYVLFDLKKATITVSQEFKTLPRALSLELNDTSTSNLPFENYTGYLLSHGLYSKFCSLLSRLSMDFVQPTCRSSYNYTNRNEAYAHPLNYILLSLL